MSTEIEEEEEEKKKKRRKSTRSHPCTFPECGIRLRSRRHARRHMHLHHLGKPLFPCASCRFTAHTATGLKSHIRRHHGSQAMRATQNGHLNDTLQRLSEAYPVDCSIFRSPFNRPPPSTREERLKALLDNHRRLIIDSS